MSDYAATVTTPLNKAERISRSLGLLSGKCNVSNYNTTLLQITGITKYFKTGGVAGFTGGIIAVIPTGVSDNGHAMEWDYTTGAFKAYKPTNIAVNSTLPGSPIALVMASGGSSIHATSGVGTVTAAAVEAATDDDAGEIGFIAIGFI